MAAKSAYETSVREIAQLFADYLDGDAARPGLAVSERPLPEPARSALERSFEAFGFEAPSCAFVTLTARNPEAEGGDIALDPQALFLLVESLDPLFLVSADRASTDLLERAYRGHVTQTRAFGRPAAIFADFPKLLETDSGKHEAWRTLKSLKA